MVLNFGTPELQKGETASTVPPSTQLHRLARLAGRVIEDPFVSVTTDVLMKC